jgi:hypothetical protein
VCAAKTYCFVQHRRGFCRCSTRRDAKSLTDGTAADASAPVPAVVMGAAMFQMCCVFCESRFYVHFNGSRTVVSTTQPFAAVSHIWLHFHATDTDERSLVEQVGNSRVDLEPQPPNSTAQHTVTTQMRDGHTRTFSTTAFTTVVRRLKGRAWFRWLVDMRQRAGLASRATPHTGLGLEQQELAHELVARVFHFHTTTKPLSMTPKTWLPCAAIECRRRDCIFTPQGSRHRRG